MKEGACDFFTKSVDGAALLNAIEKALQLDRATAIDWTELWPS
jgi:FixJ family two-component response regulator